MMRQLLLFILLFLVQTSSAQSTLIEDSSNYQSVESASTENEEVTTIDSPRHISESAWQKIKADKDYIYHPNKIKPTKKTSPKRNWAPLAFLTGKFFVGLLIAIVLFAIALVLYHLVSNGSFNYFKSSSPKTEPTEPDELNLVNETTDWEKALQHALQSEDYRTAYRILFLQVLQQLNQAQKIKYSEEKTNWHYVNALSGTALQAPFRSLTRSFDYIWYGEFKPDANMFQQLQLEVYRFTQNIQAS